MYVPHWQIDDGDFERPVVGMAFDHVLVFTSVSGRPGMYYGHFGREVTVTGVAEWLRDHRSQTEGMFPTAIHALGFTLYWDAPVVTEGPVTLIGTIDASSHGSAPAGFPAVTGVVASMELASLLHEGGEYVGNDREGRFWRPAPGFHQQFRPISSYPADVETHDSPDSPQLKRTGVVLHVEIDPAAVRGGVSPADTISELRPDADGSPIRVRIFPDYASTVLWLFGPVAYPDSAVSPALARDMALWESSYYASLDSDQSWKSASGAEQFTAAGRVLAERLAAELGRDFDVEFHSYEPGSRREFFHSGARAGNPAAAEAFHGIAAEEESERARFEDLSGEEGAGFFAYAPLSGAVFNPSNISLPDLAADNTDLPADD